MLTSARLAKRQSQQSLRRQPARALSAEQRETRPHRLKRSSLGPLPVLLILGLPPRRRRQQAPRHSMLVLVPLPGRHCRTLSPRDGSQIQGEREPSRPRTIIWRKACSYWAWLRRHMSDGTASCAAGVRLKKMRGSGLRCDTGHSFIHVFLFGPVKPLENLRFS